jgi:hypothetical protein
MRKISENASHFCHANLHFYSFVAYQWREFQAEESDCVFATYYVRHMLLFIGKFSRYGHCSACTQALSSGCITDYIFCSLPSVYIKYRWGSFVCVQGIIALKSNTILREDRLNKRNKRMWKHCSADCLCPNSVLPAVLNTFPWSFSLFRRKFER